MDRLNILAKISRRYRYSPLVEDDAIRLIVLHPAPNVGDDLHVSIVHTSLSAISDSPDDPDVFTALSYFWGEQELLKPVYIGKNELLIGPSLHSALQHLRKKEEEILVWADGLCINQRDTKERNRQVHRTGNIYSKAAKTVAYIGDEGGNTCLSAWNFLEREVLDPESRRLKEPVTAFRGDIGDVEIDVLSRPWFQRVWVVQEVTVSRNIIVQCGSRSVSWDDFCKVVLLEPRLNDRYGFSLRNKELYEYLVELFLTRCAFLVSRTLHHLLPPWYYAIEDTQARSDHILDMVSRSRRRQASDPRDKIFALLGISSGLNLEDQRVAVDYSKSVARVFIDFTSYLIESFGRYDVLSHAGRHHKSAYFIPSWVPDWSTSWNMPRTVLSSLPNRKMQRHNRGELPQYKINKILHPPKKDLKFSRLHCMGTVIGRVNSVSPIIKLRGNDELMFENLREKYKMNPQEMRAEILKIWKRYPWEDALSVDAYDSLPKNCIASNSWNPIRTSTMSAPRSRFAEDIEMRFGTRLDNNETEAPFDNGYGNRDDSDDDSGDDSRPGRISRTLAENGPNNRWSRLIEASHWSKPEIEELAAENSVFVPKWLRRLQRTRLKTDTESRSPAEEPSLGSKVLPSWDAEPVEVSLTLPIKLDAVALSSSDTDSVRNPESIENHLVRRSRQTVLWTDDATLAVEIIIDKSSIIDRRRLAAYKPSSVLIDKINKHYDHSSKFHSQIDMASTDLGQVITENEQLALVPGKAKFDDVIITLKGGNIPYVVRRSDRQWRSNEASLHPPSEIRCQLIGECYINNFELIHDNLMKLGKGTTFILE